MNDSNKESQNEVLKFNYNGENIEVNCYAEIPEKKPVDLNRIIPQLTKSEGGLYPHEILMLNIVSRYKSNCENNFQWFWKNDFGVDNPQALIGKQPSQEKHVNESIRV